MENLVKKQYEREQEKAEKKEAWLKIKRKQQQTEQDAQRERDDVTFGDWVYESVEELDVKVLTPDSAPLTDRQRRALERLGFYFEVYSCSEHYMLTNSMTDFYNANDGETTPLVIVANFNDDHVTEKEYAALDKFFNDLPGPALEESLGDDIEGHQYSLHFNFHIPEGMLFAIEDVFAEKVATIHPKYSWKN